MGKPLQGSINFTELMNAAKAANTAFSRSEKNKQVYANVTLWINDEPDQYGNTVSLQLNPKRDTPDKKIYFGNFKGELSANKKKPDYEQLPDSKSDDDDLPF